VPDPLPDDHVVLFRDPQGQALAAFDLREALLLELPQWLLDPVVSAAAVVSQPAEDPHSAISRGSLSA
jgi:hypothetical protein